MNPAKDPRVRLQHILDEIDGVTAFTAELSASRILASYAHSRVVERAIQIISEAARELPESLRATEPAIPWRNIIGIGNYLRHEYYRIDRSVLDSVLHDQLPKLRAEFVRMMDRPAP